jgi:hypothetical protein
MFINIKKTTLFVAIGGLLAACSPSEPAPAEVEVIAEEGLDITEADNMIRQLPSPIEMAILVKHSGGEYNASLLNPIQNIDRYATVGKKTVNMGTYSADVGYTSLYKQTQETVFYLNNIRKLSDAIGLSDAFDKSMFERIESNIEHRDSLLMILSKAYDTSNEYLKVNDRLNTSLLMLAGGWIETMYLAANLGETGGRPNQDIAMRVAQQDLVLKKIIAGMRTIKTDPLVTEFADKLEELSVIFVAPELISGEGENAKVDMVKMEKVFTKIDEIRAWVIA